MDKSVCEPHWTKHNILMCKIRFDSNSKMGLNMVGAAVIIPDNSDGTDPENPYGDGEKLLI